jgi:hypothetical protein
MSQEQASAVAKASPSSAAPRAEKRPNPVARFVEHISKGVSPFRYRRDVFDTGEN